MPVRSAYRGRRTATTMKLAGMSATRAPNWAVARLTSAPALPARSENGPFSEPPNC